MKEMLTLFPPPRLVSSFSIFSTLHPAQLLKVASITCNGRVVSVLEGGYGAHRTRGARSSSACCVDSDGGSSAGSGRRRTRRKRSRASPSDADGSSSDRSSSRGGGSVPPAELASTSAAVKQPVVVAAAAAAAAQGKGKRKGNARETPGRKTDRP